MRTLPTCAYPGCGKESVGIYGLAKIPKCYDHASLALTPSSIADVATTGLLEFQRSRRASGLHELVAEHVPDALPEETSDAAMKTAEAIEAVRAARTQYRVAVKMERAAYENHNRAAEVAEDARLAVQAAEQKLLDLIADGDR